jgi:hypothetical protein
VRLTGRVAAFPSVLTRIELRQSARTRKEYYIAHLASVVFREALPALAEGNGLKFFEGLELISSKLGLRLVPHGEAKIVNRSARNSRKYGSFRMKYL